MKKEEIDVLVDNKIKEGKSLKKIFKEIKDLGLSQIKFKKLELALRRSKKENLKLQIELNGIKKKQLVRNLSEYQSEKGDLKYLNRILVVLHTTGKSIMHKELRDGCCATGKELNPCLNFLKKWKLINMERKGNAFCYAIK